MIDGIRERFRAESLLNEELDLLAEMSETDLLDEIDSDVISPEERKKLEQELKKIPEDLESDAKITNKDLKAVEHDADPSIEDLAESLMFER